MAVDIKHLDALAAKATGWADSFQTRYGSNIYLSVLEANDVPNCDGVVNPNITQQRNVVCCFDAKDADFIAAAHPAAIQELISRLYSAEGAAFIRGEFLLQLAEIMGIDNACKKDILLLVTALKEVAHDLVVENSELKAALAELAKEGD